MNFISICTFQPHKNVTLYFVISYRGVLLQALQFTQNKIEFSENMYMSCLYKMCFNINKNIYIVYRELRIYDKSYPPLSYEIKINQVCNWSFHSIKCINT